MRVGIKLKPSTIGPTGRSARNDKNGNLEEPAGEEYAKPPVAKILKDKHKTSVTLVFGGFF